ncbi:MAG: type III secretory pathway component EscR [Patiriisocius sp.]|jgi:hypothetical protein
MLDVILILLVTLCQNFLKMNVVNTILRHGLGARLLSFGLNKFFVCARF